MAQPTSNTPGSLPRGVATLIASIVLVVGIGVIAWGVLSFFRAGQVQQLEKQKVDAIVQAQSLFTFFNTYRQWPSKGDSRYQTLFNAVDVIQYASCSGGAGSEPTECIPGSVDVLYDRTVSHECASGPRYGCNSVWFTLYQDTAQLKVFTSVNNDTCEALLTEATLDRVSWSCTSRQ